MAAERHTLAQFLAARRRRDRGASEELHALVLDIAAACRTVAQAIVRDRLSTLRSARPGASAPATLHDVALQAFMRALTPRAYVAGIAWAGMDAPYLAPAPHAQASFLVTLEPLEGAPNLETGAPAGSLFAVLPAAAARPTTTADFLQPGQQQLAAGYALYGPATLLVLSLGAGVHGFTLVPRLGDFVLTHPRQKIPIGTRHLAFNAARGRFWEAAVKRYVSECVAGITGLRGKDFDMYWSGSLVAETHRLLMRGGVLLCPRVSPPAPADARLHLLYEANPLSFLVEQAGGRASTGRERMLEVVPSALSQQTSLLAGAREEIERLEQYHHDQGPSAYDAPLFGLRGLFRTLN